MTEQSEVDLRVREIEQEIDEHPLTLTLCSESRETAYWYSLLAHETRCYGAMGRADRGVRYSDIIRDTSKYALRNVLRWLDACPRRSGYQLPPRRVNVRRAKAAAEMFQLGLDYDGVIVAYVYYNRGIATAELVDQNTVHFRSSLEELRIDVLERLRHTDNTREHIERVGQSLLRNGDAQESIERIKQSCRPGVGDNITVNVDPHILRPLLDIHTAFLKRLFLFPSDWQFRGIAIEAFRSVWCAISVLASVHIFCHLSRFHPRVYPDGLCSVVSMKPRDDWIRDIAQLCAPLPVDMVRATVDLLTYNSGLPDRLRDPGLQPFVEIAAGVLAICPHLVDSSSHERNLMALLARRYPDEYSATTGDLEDTLLTEMYSYCHKQNILVSRNRKLPGRQLLPDVDLALFDQTTGLLMILEVKWVIPPADVQEKFARAEREKEGIEQVRKLLEHSDQHRQEIVTACFPKLNLRCDKIVGHVVVRGFDGTFFNRDTEICLIEETLFRRKLESGSTLDGLDAWLRGRSYLPVAGRDFAVKQQSLKIGRNTIITDGFKVLASGVPNMPA